MTVAVTFTKLMVTDIDAAEAFYREALGLTALGSQVAGYGELAQELRPLSAGGQPNEVRLVLSRYRERSAPLAGAAWVGFMVEDADETLRAITAAGGKVVKAAADELEHGVRAAIASDLDGHLIELTQILAPSE